MDYQEFLKQKKVSVKACGFDCEERNPALFDFIQEKEEKSK